MEYFCNLCIFFSRIIINIFSLIYQKQIFFPVEKTEGEELGLTSI